jgi:hypothetical protein
MKYFAVRDTLPAHACREVVETVDIYVLIAGFRYGSLVPGLHPPMSYTELEFDTAASAAKPRLVFLIDEAALGAGLALVDLAHDARQLAFREKARTGLVAAIVADPGELKARLVDALHKLRRPSTASVPTGPVWNIPPRLPEFTGRAGLLAELDAGLGAGGPVVVQAVTGIGGVGKSSTAIEYAYRHVDEFDIAWWVPAEDSDLVPDRLAALAHALDLCPPTEPLTTAVARLSAYLLQRRRWLIVFDNAENPDALAPLLPAGPGRVVITSRDPGVESLPRSGSPNSPAPSPSPCCATSPPL